MALVKCKDCGKDVSTDAKNCPHCAALVFATPEAQQEYEKQQQGYNEYFESQREAQRKHAAESNARAAASPRSSHSDRQRSLEKLILYPLHGAVFAIPLLGNVFFFLWWLSLAGKIFVRSENRLVDFGMWIVFAAGYYIGTAIAINSNNYISWYYAGFTFIWFMGFAYWFIDIRKIATIEFRKDFIVRVY